jgi:hypothetical protein
VEVDRWRHPRDGGAIVRRRKPAPHSIAADPIGAVLILSGAPDKAGNAPAILLNADGSAVALAVVPKDGGGWSLSEPTGQLTPQMVRECFLGMKNIRQEASKEIERLIALLDRLDPDPDLEDNELDGPDTDLEPSLGSVEQHPHPDAHSVAKGNQERWSQGAYGSEHEMDREDEHDGREPDEADLEADECELPASLHCGPTVERPDWNPRKVDTEVPMKD